MNASDYKPVPVSEAKRIAAAHAKQWVVILSGDAIHGQIHTTTYGANAAYKEIAAEVGESCAKHLGCDLGQAASFEDFRNRTQAEAAEALERLEELQASLTRLAQHLGFDPDGMDDDSVIRAIQHRWDDLAASTN